MMHGQRNIKLRLLLSAQIPLRKRRAPIKMHSCVAVGVHESM